MQHLVIKSIQTIRPGDMSRSVVDKIEPFMAKWVGKHSTQANHKIMRRELKKLVGWFMYRVTFSEFDCRSGRLVFRITKL